MSDPRQYWVGFNLVKGIGAARLRALLDHFRSVEAAWQAPYDALQATGLNAKIINALVKVRTEIDLDGFMERIQAQGIQVLTWEDETYPARLKEIAQPPPVIYVRGSLLPGDDWAVAIVGTRRLTAYGRQIAEELAALLAANGITVISGLARGVDGVAHQAALQNGGRTLAVLGCGVDIFYPPEHRRLAEQICASGALLSDYPPGTPPDAVNFPPRNRIISGLSRAVVVVEAGETSGALITAAFAAEQGRDVFAVPGNILAPQSKGTNRLIQEGAHPLLNLPALLDALDLEHAQDQRQARTELPADATEALLYALLGREPLHVDEIGAQANLPIEKITAALAIMELKGLVRQMGGMNYIAVREPRAGYAARQDEPGEGEP